MSAMDPGGRNDAWPLICPVCERELRSEPGTLVCPSGHSFDVAREGYVNLLPPQHRVRGIEGDSLAMLQARRRFLESGHYRPLLDQLVAEVGSCLADSDVARSDADRGACVLEVGCGEGYYIGSIAERLKGRAGATPVFMGADISKSAVRLASRRYHHARFIVADVRRRIYVQTGSANVLLDVFAPRDASEFARVVPPGGAAIVVIPSEAHLASLRTALGLLDIQEDKEAHVREQLRDGFGLADRKELRYPMELSADSAMDVMRMGPSSRHRTEDSAALMGDSIATEAAFAILRLERT